MGRVSRRQRQPGTLRRAQARRPRASLRASRESKAPRRSKPARARVGPDQILLVTLPKIDRAAQGSAWFSALADAGVAIAVYPLERDALPAWIAARLARQRQRAAPETLAFLADRCEGNLLAAHQEIEKLGLLLPEGELGAEAVERAMTDVARYDVFQLSEAWLAPDAARALASSPRSKPKAKASRCCCGSSERTSMPSRRCRRRVAGGTPIAVAVRDARVWGKRQAAMERAARRVPPRLVGPLMAALARLDALAKGIGRGNVWDELRSVAMTLAGSPALPLPAPDGR